MALAETPEQFQAVAAVFDELKQHEVALQADLAKIPSKPGQTDIESEVKAALEFAEDLVARLGEGMDFAMARQVLDSTNAKLYLSFCPTKVKKANIEQTKGGIVTFGSAPAPIKVYTGLTARNRLKEPSDLTKQVTKSPNKKEQ